MAELEIDNVLLGDLVRSAQAILKTRVRAEDAVQDVLLKMVEKPSLLDAVDNQVAFLKRCIHNHCLNIIRAEKRRIETTPSLDFIEDLHYRYRDSPEPSPEESLIMKENFTAAGLLLDRLGPKLEEAYFLKVVCELSNKEMASKLGISEGAARGRYQRAKVAFEALVKGE